MNILLILVSVLTVGCSGGNQTTESGGSVSRSVKYPYPAPVQDVKIEQPAPKAAQVAEVKVEQSPSKPTRRAVRNNDAQIRKGEQSRRHSPPYP